MYRHQKDVGGVLVPALGEAGTWNNVCEIGDTGKLLTIVLPLPPVAIGKDIVFARRTETNLTRELASMSWPLETVFK